MAENIIEKKEIEVPYEGKMVKVTIKKFLARTMNEMYQKAMKTTMIGATPKTDIDFISLKELTVFNGIIDAPFPHATREELYSHLKQDTEAAIHKALEEYNALSQKK